MLFFCQKAVSQLSLAAEALHSGDMLFCTDRSGDLSGAIDRATQSGRETHFSHVAIVECRGDSIWVIHSAPKKGVCRESLKQFIATEQPYMLDVYRLKPEWQKAIEPALQQAEALLGEKYNFSYRIEDPGIYCSELIWMLFRKSDIFTLAPMSFSDALTGMPIAEWQQHYRKLGIAIPEGEPGCNPNGMAASEKLTWLGKLKTDGTGLNN